MAAQRPLLRDTECTRDRRNTASRNQWRSAGGEVDGALDEKENPPAAVSSVAGRMVKALAEGGRTRIARARRRHVWVPRRNAASSCAPCRACKQAASDAEFNRKRS
jgi:hypothetical protein